MDKMASKEDWQDNFKSNLGWVEKIHGSKLVENSYMPSQNVEKRISPKSVLS